jgi:hypothetical protein
MLSNKSAAIRTAEVVLVRQYRPQDYAVIAQYLAPGAFSLSAPRRSAHRRAVPLRATRHELKVVLFGHIPLFCAALLPGDQSVASQAAACTRSLPGVYRRECWVGACGAPGPVEARARRCSSGPSRCSPRPLWEEGCSGAYPPGRSYPGPCAGKEPLALERAARHPSPAPVWGQGPGLAGRAGMPPMPPPLRLRVCHRAAPAGDHMPLPTPLWGRVPRCPASASSF